MPNGNTFSKRRPTSRNHDGSRGAQHPTPHPPTPVEVDNRRRHSAMPVHGSSFPLLSSTFAVLAPSNPLSSKLPLEYRQQQGEDRLAHGKDGVLGGTIKKADGGDGYGTVPLAEAVGLETAPLARLLVILSRDLAVSDYTI